MSIAIKFGGNTVHVSTEGRNARRKKLQVLDLNTGEKWATYETVVKCLSDNVNYVFSTNKGKYVVHVNNGGISSWAQVSIFENTSKLKGYMNAPSGSKKNPCMEIIASNSHDTIRVE